MDTLEDRFTHSIQWAVRQPAEPELAQKKLQGALEGDGRERLNGHVCFSVQHPFHLSSAQCLSSSASESRHSRCYNTEILLHLCHSCYVGVRSTFMKMAAKASRS